MIHFQVNLIGGGTIELGPGVAVITHSEHLGPAFFPKCSSLVATISDSVTTAQLRHHLGRTIQEVEDGDVEGLGGVYTDVPGTLGCPYRVTGTHSTDVATLVWQLDGMTLLTLLPLSLSHWNIAQLVIRHVLTTISGN